MPIDRGPIERESDRFQLLSRRALLLGGLQLGITSILAGRVFYLQILKGREYRLLSEENRVSLRILAPPRGQIVDRFGVPLALNQQSFQAVLVPEEVKDISLVLDNLAAILGLDEQDRKRIMREIQRGRSFVPVTVRENLTQEQVDKLEVNTPDLPGLNVESGSVRQYPLSDATAHIIGYVGAPSESDLKNNDTLLSLPGYKIGKEGIEKTYEDMLRGTGGAVQMEVNAGGRVVRELSRTAPIAGRQVTLTLDAELQHYVQERLAQERSAASVVMNAHNGDIYALASNPAFDPNIFAQGIPFDVWEQLRSDEANPLSNKAIAGQYPPGSTFKMVVALAALEAGLATPDSTVFCSGHMDLGNHRFHCWRKEGHGTVALTNALAQSCDVYFYEMGRRLGIDRIAAMAKRLGFGDKSGIDLPNEKPGFVPDRAWKRRKRKEAWQMGETLVNSIGQGYMLATPLQLAVMTSRLVNGGFEVRPRLVHSVDSNLTQRQIWPSLGIANASLQAVMQGMAACTAPGGTAHSAQIPDPRFAMAGKTGTSQVRRITMAERAAGIDINQLAWRFRHHALFVGYAPFDAPRYAVATIIEHGGSGGAVAAPLGRDLLWRCQQRDPAREGV